MLTGSQVEKELHPEAFFNGIKSSSLQFSEALVTTTNKFFEGDTENMSTEYWGTLLSKESIQECLEMSNKYREDVDTQYLELFHPLYRSALLSDNLETLLF